MEDNSFVSDNKTIIANHFYLYIIHLFKMNTHYETPPGVKSAPLILTMSRCSTFFPLVLVLRVYILRLGYPI